MLDDAAAPAAGLVFRLPLDPTGQPSRWQRPATAEGRLSPVIPRQAAVAAGAAMAEDQGPLLTKARRVVAQTMEHEFAQMLFNEPVDPDALGLPDYFDVVKEPMDLGTVYSRLDKKKKKFCFYKTVEEVHREVSLVWSNCYEYNVEDQEVRSMCDDVAALFEALWESAGLPKCQQAARPKLHRPAAALLQPPPPEAVEEEEEEEEDRGEEAAGQGSDADVEQLPEGYSMASDEGDLPLRLLDDFSVALASDPDEVVSLREMAPWGRRGGPELTVAGRVPHLDDPDAEPIELALPLCCDWCIEYSSPPAIWVLTPNAWYKLLEPAPEYEDLHKATLLSAELVAQVVQAGKRGTDPKTLAEREELLSKAGFLVPQLKAYSEGATERKLYGRDMSRKVAAFVLQLEERLNSSKHAGPSQDFFTPQPLGKRARKSTYKRDSDSDDDDDYVPSPEDSLARPPSRWKRTSKVAAVKYLTAEEELRLWNGWVEDADAARGEPPEPSRPYRLPMSWMGDVIMIWDLTQTFGALMQIPPFPLWRLEAALAPMPLKFLPSGVPPGRPAQDGGGEASGEEVASGEERPPKRPRLAEGEDEGERDKEEEEAGEIAEEVPDAAPLSLEEAIVDDAGLASGALMRDIHLGLLSVLDGSAAKNASGVPQPRFVRPMAVEGNGPFWPERVHDVLNKADDIQLNWAELFPALPDAMKFLQAGTYCFTTPAQRLDILRALHSLVIKQDVIRSYYQSELDSIATIAKAAVDAAKPPLPPKAPAIGEDGQPLPEPPAPTPPPPPRPESIAAWMRWRCTAGLTVGGTFLGEDLGRRRYWVLGGQAGAWSVHVEAPDGRRWGCYHGRAVRKLLAWLEAGGVFPPEAALVAALKAAPLPPWEQQAAAAEAEAASAAEGAAAKEGSAEGGASREGSEGGAEAADAMELDAEAAEAEDKLEARRFDGYRGMVAPMTVGLGDDARGFNIPLNSYIYLMANSLLCRVRFWEHDQASLATQIQMLAGMSIANNVPLLAAYMMKLEDHLRQSGGLLDSWEALGISAAWQAALRQQANSGTMTTLVNLMERLNVYARYQNPCVSRSSFVSLAEYLKCQLYFPTIAETVVLLRSGCKLHLENYLTGSAPGSPEAKLVAELLQTVTQLRSVQRYVVVSAAYLGVSYSSDASRQRNQLPAEEVAVEGEAGPAGDAETKEEAEGQEEGPEEGGEGDGEGGGAEGGMKAEAMEVDKGEDGAQVEEEEEEAGALEIPRVWLLLAPAASPVCACVAPAAMPIALPIPVDIELPDYLVPGGEYERAARNLWQLGDRFRMFFGSKTASRADQGAYYKGSIVAIEAGAVQAGLLGHTEADPWESIVVEWDGEQESGQNKVSPWEIERDPEEEQRRAVEQYRQEQAAAKAARIAARQAATEQMATGRSGSLTAGLPTPAPLPALAAPPRPPAPPQAPPAAAAVTATAAGKAPPVTAPLRAVPLPIVNSLQRDSFLQIVEHHYAQIGKKFKVPIFAHLPLDLYTASPHSPPPPPAFPCRIACH
eukprot:jgi/Tetstr1/440639/TSEL_028949.t1